MDNDQVSFGWIDYRHRARHKSKTMTLAAEEFLRRFLLHALPSGFQRIRYFGLLANCHRKHRLEQGRQLLGTEMTELLPDAASKTLALLAYTPRRCPHCGVGTLVRTRILEPTPAAAPAYLDSS